MGILFKTSLSLLLNAETLLIRVTSIGHALLTMLRRNLVRVVISNRYIMIQSHSVVSIVQYAVYAPKRKSLFLPVTSPIAMLRNIPKFCYNISTASKLTSMTRDGAAKTATPSFFEVTATCVELAAAVTKMPLTDCVVRRVVLLPSR